MTDRRANHRKALTPEGSAAKRMRQVDDLFLSSWLHAVAAATVIGILQPLVSEGVVTGLVFLAVAAAACWAGSQRGAS